MLVRGLGIRNSSQASLNARPRRNSVIFISSVTNKQTNVGSEKCAKIEHFLGLTEPFQLQCPFESNPQQVYTKLELGLIKFASQD